MVAVIVMVMVMVMVVVVVVVGGCPRSLALEGKAVQPRDEVDVLGVTLMRITWLLDGKGLEVLYKAQPERQSCDAREPLKNPASSLKHTISTGDSQIKV
ncbi:hypothetical protein E2C01_034987 [Portunus trituberculatus]|uniref:Uncharacterized protein n=1 Tax=Portunus trituberculatus TaxID=210409 RepID=A0A5B7F8G2_PORTR|nr:hypothetical protein [Portunus trituberculatus]